MEMERNRSVRTAAPPFFIRRVYERLQRRIGWYEAARARFLQVNLDRLGNATQAPEARMNQCSSRQRWISRRLLRIPFLVVVPSGCIWLLLTLHGTGGCGLREGLPYLGCGIAHWWVPVFVAMSGISLLIAFAAFYNSCQPDPDIPLTILDPEMQRAVRIPAKHVCIEDSKRRDINGDYELDESSTADIDYDPIKSRWRKRDQVIIFEHGKTGIICDDNGLVQAVTDGSQAQENGIRKGYRIVKIGTIPFSKAELDHADKSPRGYEVTVRSFLVLCSDITDWEIVHENHSEICYAHSLRHHRGRMPYQYSAFWRCVYDDPEKGELTVMDPKLKIIASDNDGVSEALALKRKSFLKHFGLLWSAAALGFITPLVVFLYFRVLDIPGFPNTLVKGQDRSSFALPRDAGHDTDGVQQRCGCVVIDGVSILQPFSYSLFSVVVLFLGNMVVTMCKAQQCREHPVSAGRTPSVGVWLMSKLDKLLWRSTVNPSRSLVALSCLINFANLGALVFGQIQSIVQGRMQWHIALRIIITNFMDSGAMSVYVTCLYGSFLTLVYFASEKTGATAEKDYPSAATGPGLRIKAGYVFFCLKVPAMLGFVWLAKVKWFWISFLSELFLSLLIEIFVPEAAQSAHAFLVRRRRWKELSNSNAHNTFSSLGPCIQYAVAVSFLPLQEVVGWFCQRNGLMMKLSPLSDGGKAFAVALFIMVKTVELQFFSSLQLFAYLGIGYLDSVPLGFQARHGHCGVCLLQNRVKENVERISFQLSTFFLS